MCRSSPAWPHSGAAGNVKLQDLRQPRPGARGGGRVPAGWVAGDDDHSFILMKWLVLGMFPLLFIDTSKEEKSEENNS